jgi:hypothetical protein
MAKIKAVMVEPIEVSNNVRVLAINPDPQHSHKILPADNILRNRLHGPPALHESKQYKFLPQHNNDPVHKEFQHIIIVCTSFLILLNYE